MTGNSITWVSSLFPYGPVTVHGVDYVSPEARAHLNAQAALALARADGSYVRVLERLARVDVLVIDDWGLKPAAEAERHDLLEVIDDRYGVRSTIVTSQVPTAKWHEYLNEPTIADAILDRLLHNAHKVVLKGPSRRKENHKEEMVAASA